MRVDESGLDELLDAASHLVVEDGFDDTRRIVYVKRARTHYGE